MYRHLLNHISLRRQAIDPSSFRIYHLVAAHSRIVPVADEHSSIRGYSNIRWAKPPILGAHRRFDLRCVSSAFRLNEVGVDQSCAGLSMEQMSTISFRKQFPLVDDHAARSSCAQSQDVWHDSRQFRM